MMRLADLSPEDRTQIEADLDAERMERQRQILDDILVELAEDRKKAGLPAPLDERGVFLQERTTFRAARGDDDPCETTRVSFAIETKGDTLGYQRLSLIFDGKDGRDVYHLTSHVLGEFREKFDRYAVLVEAANDLKRQVESPKMFGTPLKIGEEVFILDSISIDTSPKFRYGQRGLVQDTNWRGLGLVLVAIVVPARGRDGSLWAWDDERPTIRIAYKPSDLKRVADCSEEMQEYYDKNCRIGCKKGLPSARAVKYALKWNGIKFLPGYQPWAVREPRKRRAPAQKLAKKPDA